MKAGTALGQWISASVLVGLAVSATGCKKLAQMLHPTPPAFAQPRVDAAFQKMVGKITDDPKFQEVLKNPPADDGQKLDLAVKATGSGELGAQLAAKGTARLQTNEFLEVSKLKLKLAEASPKLCAGFWGGGITSADLGAGLDKLSDAELDRWFELSERAVHLELYTTAPLPRFQGKVLVEGIRQIAGALPGNEGESLMAIMRQGTNAPPADGCKAYMALTKGALAFPDSQRDQFLRAMTFDKLVDW